MQREYIHAKDAIKHKSLFLNGDLINLKQGNCILYHLTQLCNLTLNDGQKAQAVYSRESGITVLWV